MLRASFLSLYLFICYKCLAKKERHALSNLITFSVYNNNVWQIKKCWPSLKNGG